MHGPFDGILPQPVRYAHLAFNGVYGLMKQLNELRAIISIHWTSVSGYSVAGDLVIKNSRKFLEMNIDIFYSKNRWTFVLKKLYII